MLGQGENRNRLEALHSEHRQLAILRALSRLPGCSGNAALLRDWLEEIGLVATSECVRSDLRHLKELGLINLDEAPASAWRTSLTVRGEDVAKGRTVVEGIQRPGPECAY